MIDVFLKVQEPDYFLYLLSIVGKTFVEVIKIGKMVENGIKSGKIVSRAVLKATTQVIKNGSRSLGEKKMEDVAIVVSGTQKSSRGPLYQCAPSQFHRYHPMQDTQYSIVHLNMQPIVHKHMHIHQTIINGERQHINTLVLLLKIFEHLIIPVQCRNLEEIRGVGTNSHQLESLTQVYLRNCNI